MQDARGSDNYYDIQQRNNIVAGLIPDEVIF
jgi:hypothetical protein